MCGIIAVLRRRNDRPPPAASDVLPLLESAPVALGRRVRRARPGSECSTRWPTSRASRPAPAWRRRDLQALLGRPLAGRRHRPPLCTEITVLDRHGRGRARPEWDRPRGGRLGGVQRRRSSGSRTPRGPSSVIGCRWSAAVDDLAGSDAGRAAIEGVHVDPGRAVGNRSPRGAWTRFGGTAPARPRSRSGSDGAGDREPARRSRRPAVRDRCGAGHPGGSPQLRVQGGGRDRRARRQHT